MDDRVKIWAKYGFKNYKLKYEARSATAFLNLIYVVDLYENRYMDFTFTEVAPNEFKIKLHEDTVVRISQNPPVFLRDTELLCRKERKCHTFTAVTALPDKEDPLDEFIQTMRKRHVRVYLVD